MAALRDAQARLRAKWTDCGRSQRLGPTHPQPQPRMEDYKELAGFFKLLLTSSPAEPESGCAAIFVAGAPPSPENYNSDTLAQFIQSVLVERIHQMCNQI